MFIPGMKFRFRMAPDIEGMALNKTFDGKRWDYECVWMHEGQRICEWCSELEIELTREA